MERKMTEQTFLELAKSFQGNCNCVSQKKNQDEGKFRHRNCDCCNSLPGIHYEIVGYNPKTQKIEELGYICADCLYFFAYGDIPHENVV